MLYFIIEMSYNSYFSSEYERFIQEVDAKEIQPFKSINILYIYIQLIIPPSLYYFSVLTPAKTKNKDELKFPSLDFIKDGNVSLKDFNIRKEIGRGGFGRVFMVQCKLNHKYYAMKVISKEYISKKRQILRTKQEKKLLSTLRHPFIVNLKCTFQSTPALYIVMELVQVYYLYYYLFVYL